ncbi:hypothetical protein J2128_001907 [Methanomicrobium sp. W14]|uniref:PepSY domain-containing protein n=1 Tax=Methanomicrobium sp. W14 TaxID=2817839 RepID=UPI001AE4BDA6|nr:PepSY domain-containing protein [Methanomicrobium sp. W14]MBP2133941.1 hypothetical protein [Methanomicrobium sp. W14]
MFLGKANNYNTYLSPVIVFSGVLENYGAGKRTVEINYDPERKMICKYVPGGGTFWRAGGEIVVSEEEAKERAVEFYKKFIGDEYNDHENDIISVRDYGDISKVFCYVDINTVYKGVVYSYDSTRVVYGMRYDRVRDYINHQGNYDIMSQITTLSPNPGVTIEEAKQILKDYSDVDIQDGYVRSPLRLVWELPFIKKDDNKMHYITIDAHTGEIIFYE